MKKLSYFTVVVAILGMIILLGCESRMSPMETTGTEQGETNTLAKGKDGGSGKSNIGHLYLYEKDAEWVIVDGGAWGKMKYNLSGPRFNFVFNGHGLEPETEYSLIYYPDPWPGEGLIVLGSGIVNEEGNIHIKGSVDTETDLPAEYDANADPDPSGTEIYGAKIWLVLSDDVSEDPAQMIGWHHPGYYLFENAGTFFDDTDD